MRFAQKTEYGLRAVLHLAARWGQPGVPAKDIARAEGIPERFLEQQITTLRKAGIVQSQRGPAGGCKLAGHPATIALADVVRALEGELLEHDSDEERPAPSRAAVLDLWGELGGLVEARLADLTVADLLRRQQELAAARGGMFYI